MKRKMIVVVFLLGLILFAPLWAFGQNSITIITNERESFLSYMKFAGYSLWASVPLSSVELATMEQIHRQQYNKIFNMYPTKIHVLGLVKRLGEGRSSYTNYSDAKPTEKFIDALCSDIHPHGEFVKGYFNPDKFLGICSKRGTGGLT